MIRKQLASISESMRHELEEIRLCLEDRAEPNIPMASRRIRLLLDLIDKL